MTTEQAMAQLDCATESELARRLGLSRQSVNGWQGRVPEARQWQIEVLRAKQRTPAPPRTGTAT